MGPWVLLAPFLCIFAVFTAYPLGRSLVLSLHQTYGPGTQQYVGIDNYRLIATDPLFWKALRNTILYTLGSVFIQLPLSLGLALLLNRPGGAGAGDVPAGVLRAVVGGDGLRGDDVRRAV